MRSPALKGDAACGVVCVNMAATVLVGLVLRAVSGWWWADPAAALGIVYFIARAAREAPHRTTMRLLDDRIFPIQ